VTPAELEEEEQANPAAEHLLFVATSGGYELLELDGLPPPLGAVLELEFDGIHALYAVCKVARSPLPLDDRPCVYAELV
jgi:hypothetical protein